MALTNLSSSDSETQIIETQISLEKKFDSLQKSEATTKWTSVVLFIGVVIIWLVSWQLLMGNESLESWNDRAAFGDMFGAVNALFSGLALGGIVVAIFMQRIEIRYQRIELEYQRLELMQTRIELKRSAEAQEKSEQALSEQVRQMKMTAKINAIMIQMNYYSAIVSNPAFGNLIDRIKVGSVSTLHMNALTRFEELDTDLKAIISEIEKGEDFGKLDKIQ
ncbi:MAG: hypothetical protein R3D00_22695 [Bacteroidia bacterium]